jgi:hypothetical protein
VISASRFLIGWSPISPGTPASRHRARHAAAVGRMLRRASRCRLRFGYSGAPAGLEGTDDRLPWVHAVGWLARSFNSGDDSRRTIRPHLVGATPEQKPSRLGTSLDHPLLGCVVEVAKVPPAVREAAVPILVPIALCLHNPVEGHPPDHHDLPQLHLLPRCGSSRWVRPGSGARPCCLQPASPWSR